MVLHDKAQGVIISGSSLVLQRVTRKQSGNYSCVGSNIEGDTQRFFVNKGIEIWYSLRLRGVKTAITLQCSLGISMAREGSKLTSLRYFSGTRHSYSTGILLSFLSGNCCFLETPV